MKAVTFDNKTTKPTQTLQSDYPENILLDKELSGRVDPTAIEALAADIEAHGQNQPVKVRRNEDGKPVLVFGYRRYAAVALINERLAKKGERRIKLEFTAENLTPAEAFIQTIGENRNREGNTPMDDCHNINLLFNRFKMPVEEIVGIYFPEAKTNAQKKVALDWIKGRAGLAGLGKEGQEGVEKGEIKVTTAVALATLPPTVQAEIIKEETEIVKGKPRLKVSAVLARKTGKTAEKAKVAVEKAKEKKASKKDGKVRASAPSKPAASTPKPTGSVYGAAEALALAVDVWREDATDKAEKALIAAHDQYRALVPAKKDGKAA